MEKREKRKEVISALEKKIEELKARMPAHSVSAEMIQELESIEDELNRRKKE